jgi:hypothetical protein
MFGHPIKGDAIYRVDLDVLLERIERMEYKLDMAAPERDESRRVKNEIDSLRLANDSLQDTNNRLLAHIAEIRKVVLGNG